MDCHLLWELIHDLPSVLVKSTNNSQKYIPTNSVAENGSDWFIARGVLFDGGCRLVWGMTVGGLG